MIGRLLGALHGPWRLYLIVGGVLAWTLASGFVGWRLSGAASTRAALAQTRTALALEQQTQQQAAVAYRRQLSTFSAQLAQQQADSGQWLTRSAGLDQWLATFKGVLDHETPAPLAPACPGRGAGFVRLYNLAATGVPDGAATAAPPADPGRVHAGAAGGPAGAPAPAAR